MLVVLAAAVLYATAIGAVAVPLALLLRRAPAAWRHVVWWVPAAAPTICVAALVGAVGVITPFRVALPMQPWISWRWSPRAAVMVVTIWLIGAAASLVWIACGAIALHLRVRRATPVASPSWLSMLATAAAELGVRRRVALAIGSVHAPFTCGIFRPAIVLPSAARGWTEQRLRFVLLHELAHVARHDTLLRAIERVAGAILWFHPLVLVALRGGRAEREKACDDAVLAATAMPAHYSAALLAIAGEHGVLPRAAVGVTPTQLESRIVAIMDDTRARTGVRSRQAAVATLTVASLAIAAVLLGAGPLAAVDLCATGVQPSLVEVRPRARMLRMRSYSQCMELAIIGDIARPQSGVTVMVQTVSVDGTQRMIISRRGNAFFVDGQPVPFERGVPWLENAVRILDPTYAGKEIRIALSAAMSEPLRLRHTELVTVR
ncbi:MAG: M56 family metallopeptidase [Acidobacteriota bacterium]|nr:M56 family metallopeptidase [Acidobacteriota bacterium]